MFEPVHRTSASSRQSIKKLSATSRTRGDSVDDPIDLRIRYRRTFSSFSRHTGVRATLCGLVGVLLAACAAGAPAAGADPLPTALQHWAAFPIHASPRPIVLMEGLVTGPHGFYDSEKTKVAFASGAFDRPAQLPSGPDTAGGYPIISADEAFDLLKS